MVPAFFVAVNVMKEWTANGGFITLFKKLKNILSKNITKLNLKKEANDKGENND